MKKTLEIRRALKRREYLGDEINDLKKELEYLKKKIDNYNKELKELNYELMIWDDFIEKTES
jgi:peptidoglycan hydrolase CwlO-like protein